MQTVEFFRALGDATRLEMVERLSSGDTYTLTSVSSGLKISRQGARKHLQILVDAKIIRLKSKGRDVSVTLDRGALEKGKAFIAELERKWDKRLEKLKGVVEEE